MPLPLPKLDIRTWSELVAEARTLVPRNDPAWTDHNYTDPGITVAELYAWIAEMLLYRLDLVTPAMRRAFLRRLDVEVAQAVAAQTTVAIDGGGAPAFVLGSGTVVGDAAGSVVFESDGDCTVSPAWLPLSPSAAPRGRVITVAGGVQVDHTADNGAAGDGFAALGDDPQPGDALWMAFDMPPAQAGVPVTLHAWTTTWSTDYAERARIAAEWLATWRDCAAAPQPGHPTRAECEGGVPPAPPDPPFPPPWWQLPGASTVWEFWSGPAGWQPLPQVQDETRGLTLSGDVRFEGPAGHVAGPLPGMWVIRCRLDSGGYDCPPRLAAVAVNALTVRHGRSVAGPLTLGVSRGHAGERYALDTAPVLAGTTRLRLVSGAVTDDGWIEVVDWDRSGPDDAHYRLDPLAGAVEFGDGMTGRVPPAGAGIVLRSLRSGGGVAGNAAAGRLTTVLSPSPAATVVQPFAAGGGAGAETLDHARGRALDVVARPTRTVTVADVEALALSTPGVRLARARALPGYQPEFGCIPAPGVVTVVVMPPCGAPPRPRPATLAAVQRWLDRRRPLTTKIVVAAVQYRRVDVSATLHVMSTGAAAGLRDRAVADLRAFFDPLGGGGDGAGWPFGRPVRITEVQARLAALDGVAYVDGVALSTDDDPAPGCGDVALCPTELVESGTLDISVVIER